MCKLDGNYPILSHHFVDHLNHNIFKDRLIVAHFEVFDFGSFGVTSFSSLQTIDRNLQCMHREARIDVVTPACTTLVSVHFFKPLSFLFGGSFGGSFSLSLLDRHTSSLHNFHPVLCRRDVFLWSRDRRRTTRITMTMTHPNEVSTNVNLALRTRTGRS